MKRERDSEDGPSESEAKRSREEPSVPAEQPSETPDDGEEDRALYSSFRMSSAVRRGAECPYLDTISRQSLDFDFEKCCSVTLSPVNVYACLVCGKYFQVRCVSEEVGRLDGAVSWARALDGSEYMPGLVGLNNMKANDYANVVIQALIRVHPIRDFFLRPDNYAAGPGARSLLVGRFGELVRKVWNPRAFKGQVSPHEFMQARAGAAVMAASGKRFTIDRQADPVDFLSWLLNALHADLTGGKRKRRSGAWVGGRVPFLLLGLDLPPAPLFKDALEKIPIFDILKKFDGETWSEDIKLGRRRFRVTRLPRFLALHFFVEKNPTIVNFPVKNLDLAACVPVPKGPGGAAAAAKYDLVANVVHEGKAGAGTYRVHVHRKVEDIWYEVQDLRVTEVYELKQQ
eukprot:scaffold3.g6527.t1